MGKTSIYLPTELLQRAHQAGLNVSGVCRSAIEDAVAAQRPAECPRCGQPLPSSPPGEESR